MKIALHMYFEERQHYCPAMFEFKSIPSETTVRTDRGPQPRRTKCHNQKQLRRVTVQRALRTFAPNFYNNDFFLEILPLKDDELVMSEM